MSRADKMYAKSPKIDRDEDGKATVVRDDKKSAKTEEGKDKSSSKVMEMTQRHAKERLDLHHKHETEHLALAQKHYQASDDGTESAGTGGELINKVEKDGEE